MSRDRPWPHLVDTVTDRSGNAIDEDVSTRMRTVKDDGQIRPDGDVDELNQTSKDSNVIGLTDQKGKQPDRRDREEGGLGSTEEKTETFGDCEADAMPFVAEGANDDAEVVYSAFNGYQGLLGMLSASRLHLKSVPQIRNRCVEHFARRKNRGVSRKDLASKVHGLIVKRCRLATENLLCYCAPIAGSLFASSFLPNTSSSERTDLSQFIEDIEGTNSETDNTSKGGFELLRNEFHQENQYFLDNVLPSQPNETQVCSEQGLTPISSCSNLEKVVDSEKSVIGPLVFDSTGASILNFKPPKSLRITFLTIGSRGDVQPYIALAKRFRLDGHHVRIVSHEEFRDWILGHEIDFRPIGGDPAELMRICVDHGMFTVSFMREVNLKFRPWLDALLQSAWEACQATEVLIESPSTMAGIHIAEALKIPYFRAFTMPWTQTKVYPHAFAVPMSKLGGAYNYFSYTLFEHVFWRAISGQINKWRESTLGLKPTNFKAMQANKVPFIYNFSPHVVPAPDDWPHWVKICGYWFLDHAEPNLQQGRLTELSKFISHAKKIGKKLVYIGFGSIVVSNIALLNKTIIESVLKADVCCILSRGWSDRGNLASGQSASLEFPAEIFLVDSAPHDWLFSQIDAAVHHGGAGTTGASLRAGLPTVIKPFFGDQYFWAGRIQDLGVGIHLTKMNKHCLAKALIKVTRNKHMISIAQSLGEKIRNEDGVGTAVKFIYRELEYAKSLIKDDQPISDSDESWTLVEPYDSMEMDDMMDDLDYYEVLSRPG